MNSYNIFLNLYHMNRNGHLMYGGSGASNMVAKIISTNQRQFNLNKMAHPSANLQRRYGDGSFEIDDSYWRMAPTPHRWDGGVARNTQQPQQTPQYTPLTEKIPSEIAPRNYPVISRQPRDRFDTPTVEIPQPQFIQLTPQLSIPVQNLQNQNQAQLPMAIAEPTPRENFQPEAPKLSEKVEKEVKPITNKSSVEIKDYGDDRNGLYFRPQGKLVQYGGKFIEFSNIIDNFKKNENFELVKKSYNEFISKYNELIQELNNQKERIKRYIQTIDDETQIERAKKQLQQVRNEYKNPKQHLERAMKMYEKIKKKK